MTKSSTGTPDLAKEAARAQRQLQDLSQGLADASIEIADLKALLKEGLTALKTAEEALRLCEGVVEDAALATLPVTRAKPSPHRMARRPGRPSKFDGAPELAAFVEARLGRLTYQGIADAIAAHFPPELHVSKSAIHSWTKRRRR